MYCDYPLDNDSILEINLINILRFQHCFRSMKTVQTDENGFWNNKDASINTLVVSHNDNVSFSYFANVKHARIPCRQ